MLNGTLAIGEQERVLMEEYFTGIKSYNQSQGRDFVYNINHVSPKERRKAIHLKKKIDKQDFWSQVEKSVWLLDDLVVGAYHLFK